MLTCMFVLHFLDFCYSVDDDYYKISYVLYYIVLRHITVIIVYDCARYWCIITNELHL